VVILLGEDAFGPHGTGGQNYLLRQTPILQSTELGSGRNKLFIRGIADSSFTGPTQATAGTYFGDVRTGYNGPDPNLNLYDVDRIEVLEGPQGALYGAGSIGGVIRLAPHPADLHGSAASVEVGSSVTQHGGLGYDLAGMVNLVPSEGRIAFRAIAYRSVEPGYIDDPGRNVTNVNRIYETGARASVRVHPLDGWTADAGIFVQRGRQPDLQYSLTEGSPLTRRSAIAQPFSDDYLLGRVVVLKQWDSGLRLVSATGHVEHETDQRYDATRINFANPVAYDEHNRIRLTTSELRMSHYDADGLGWLIGASLVEDHTTKDRRFGTLATVRDLIGVDNRTNEKAVFGSITKSLGHGIRLTVGTRATHSRMDSDASLTTTANFVHGRSTTRIDPQIGLTVSAGPRIVLFTQYQQGFRTGGLAVARGVGRVATFDDDTIKVGEGGIRLLRSGSRGLAAVAAVSYARWDHIQADLVSLFGFPYTANVGDGRIVAFEGSVDWVPAEGLRATAGLFVNRSRLVNPAPDFIASGSRPLPATPPIAATGAFIWTKALGSRRLTLEINARYIGSSRLGVGPVLDLPYGNYVETGFSAAYRLKAVEFSLSIDNLLDTRGNRFAIGNPFGVQYRDEETPLRPRTFRLGAKARF
jgi:outer membrane receptor protein involved in Fe transport